MTTPGCDECEHAATSHDADGRIGCDECSCLLSEREAIEGRDERLDDAIAQALWEDAVADGEPWALGDDR